MGEHGQCRELVGLMGGAGRGFPGVFYQSSISLLSVFYPSLRTVDGASVNLLVCSIGGCCSRPVSSPKGAGDSEGSGGWWAVVHLMVYQVVIVGELR